MPESAANHQLNKGTRLHLAALLYFLSRLMVIAYIFAIPALFFIQSRVELPVVLGGACLCAALLVGYYTAASSLRCAACGSPVLLDNGNRKHPNASRFPGVNHRARVAWDILFASSYQCMYCLTRCRCKKSWGGKPGAAGRIAPHNAPLQPVGQVFPESIFGGVGDPVQSSGPESLVAESTPGAAAFHTEVQSATPQSAPIFAAAKAYPNASTVPVSLIAPPPPPAGRPRHETVPFSPAPAPPVFPPAQVLSPLFAVTSPVTSPALSAIPAPDSPRPAPLPWNLPQKSTEPAMNATPKESAPVASPFLATPPAAPTANIPAPGTRPVPDCSTEEFPFTPGSHPAEGPPPWTIPSLPPAPAAAEIQPAAKATTGPVTPLSAAPRLSTVREAAPPAGTDTLLRDVISVLEEGQRSLATAFQGLITKLESSLTAAKAAPVSDAPPVTATPVPPAPALQTAPVAVTPVNGGQKAPSPLPFTAPVAAVPASPPPPAPHLPDLLTAARHHSAPVPVAVPAPAVAAREKTAFVPLSPLPSPVPPASVNWTAPLAPASAPSVPFAAPAPVASPVTAAPPAVSPPAESGAPRRRFVKPSSLTSQQLDEVLKDAFAQPAVPEAVPQAGGSPNGHSPVTAPAPSRTAPVAVPGSIVPSRPAAPPDHALGDSPFGISDAPIAAPPGAPRTPAPFAFHKAESAVLTAPAAAGGTEAETPPWLQPITVPPARD